MELLINFVLTIQTVLFVSNIVQRRKQFRNNKQMDGYHHENLWNHTKDNLIKFFEILYERKDCIHKQKYRGCFK